MDRRSLLKLIAISTGATLIGGNALLAQTALATETAFSDDDILRLDELAETILPRTNTPGAKDAKVGAFMTVFVTDCYTPAEQAGFHDGLLQLEARSEAAYQTSFVALSAEQRLELVQELDREAKAQIADEQTAEEAEPHYFTMMKQLTLFGFFTSKVGATEVLRYVAVPGRYDGEMAYEAGQTAWATT